MFHLTQPSTPGQPACNTSFHYSTAALSGITMSAHWDSSRRTTISSAIHSTMTSRLYCPRTWTQPPMQLPIEAGAPWSFTGGPHGGWDSGSAWAALDFAPPGEACGMCIQRGVGRCSLRMDSSCAQRMGRSFKTWIMMATNKPAGLSFTCTSKHATAFRLNTYVYAGEHIGHPSCEGGFSNGTHVHLARRYNGEWIPADGNLPFNLEGWISSGNGVEYDGSLTRGDTVVEAWEGCL
jgi:hypothetical protein